MIVRCKCDDDFKFSIILPNYPRIMISKKGSVSRMKAPADRLYAIEIDEIL